MSSSEFNLIAVEHMECVPVPKNRKYDQDANVPFSWHHLTVELCVRLALGTIVFLFSRIPVFQRQMASAEWSNHSYPFTEISHYPTRVVAAILASTTLATLLLVTAVFYFWKRVPRRLIIEEIINFVFGLTLAIGLAYAICELIKNAYGRLRPDFLSRCYGSDTKSWPGVVPPIPTCTSGHSDAILEDGRKSFPSAHAAMTFVVFAYLGLFLFRKLGQIKNSGSLRIVVPALPVGYAAYISITRTQDYRHFGTDVVAGAVVGTACAFGVWLFYDRILSETYAVHSSSHRVNTMHGSSALKAPPVDAAQRREIV